MMERNHYLIEMRIIIVVPSLHFTEMKKVEFKFEVGEMYQSLPQLHCKGLPLYARLVHNFLSLFFFQLSNIFKKYVNQVIRIFVTYLFINLFMATSYELSGAIVIQPGNISQALINFTTCTFITRLDRCSVLLKLCKLDAKKSKCVH